jgi:hypothetical protein
MEEKGNSQVWKGTNFAVQEQTDIIKQHWLKMIELAKKHGASVNGMVSDCVDITFPNKDAFEEYVEGLNSNPIQ